MCKDTESSVGLQVVHFQDGRGRSPGRAFASQVSCCQGQHNGHRIGNKLESHDMKGGGKLESHDIKGGKVLVTK